MSDLRAGALLLLGLAACDPDAGNSADADVHEGGVLDAAPLNDAASADAGAIEAGAIDASRFDAGVHGGDADITTYVCPAGSDTLVLNAPVESPLVAVPGVPMAGVAGQILEGPVWSGGALYVSHFAFGQVPRSRIYRVSASGEVSLAHDDAGSNGLAVGPSGQLYAALHSIGTIAVFDGPTPTGTPRSLATAPSGARFNSPNDLVVRSDGTVYFTDPAWQAPSPAPQPSERAYRVRDGVVTALEGAPERPNGITLSPDERTLYVGGTSALVRYALDESGVPVGAPSRVTAVDGGVDGLGRDCAGNLYVTSSGGLVILDRDERLVRRWAVDGITNVAFGGVDRQTLYVTTLSADGAPRLLSAALNVPGYPD